MFMSAYYPNFTYLGKNSADEGFIIVAFDPDDGFMDTFLGMDQVYEDYYDGTKKFLYGTRYNTSATISITIIKADGSDFTMLDNRRVLKWLTGSRTASWLDLCLHKEPNEKGELVWKPVYSFLGTVTTPQQYKLDGRVVGLSFEFASLSPWAYSVPQEFNRSIAQAMHIDDDGVLFKLPLSETSVTQSGIWCNGPLTNDEAENVGATFNITPDGVLYVEDHLNAIIDNKTDDLYSHLYLDVEYTNESCTWLKIRRCLLSVEEYQAIKDAGQRVDDEYCEITQVNNIKPGEVIHITGKQFIVSYTKDQLTEKLVLDEKRVFGDDFNFVWPMLEPGNNIFLIEGDGDGHVYFTYRYPMKVGDCAMDISTYGGGIDCCGGAEMPSYDTVRWQDITGAPTSLAGYGITDAYTKSEVYSKDETYSSDQVYTKDETYSNAEVYTKDEVDDKIDDIEISGGTGGGSVTIDEAELNSMLEDILG